MVKYPINKRRHKINQIFWIVMVVSIVFAAYCVGWAVAWTGSCVCEG